MLRSLIRMGTNDKYRIFLIFLDFIFIDLLEWMVSKCQENRQERTVVGHTISKQLGVIIFERPGDAMSYFSTEEVDNLKSLRAMVTEDLINETDYEENE